jgi:hypothetical protein
VNELSAQVLSDTVSVVVKYDKDVRRALDALPRLVDPNAEIPEHPGHGHGHGHGHWHGHGHTHDDPDEPEVDGRAVRAAKDQPGRFDEGYYGAPGAGRLTRREVGPEQGSRSFARCRPL